MSEDAFDTKIVVFNDATTGAKYQDLLAVDTSLAVSVGCIRVIFLNKFVSEVMVRTVNETQFPIFSCSSHEF